MAYVGGSELLLRADDGSAALRSVQSTLAFDRGLACGDTRSTDLAADLGGGFPVVRHVDGMWCRET